MSRFFSPLQQVAHFIRLIPYAVTACFPSGWSLVLSGMNFLRVPFLFINEAVMLVHCDLFLCLSTEFHDTLLTSEVLGPFCGRV